MICISPSPFPLPLEEEGAPCGRPYNASSPGTPSRSPFCKEAQRGLSICSLRGWHPGFTITELVVALVLMGIGLALSLGMIMSRGWRESYNLSNMANSFQTTLQMARARAVARQGIVAGAWVPTGNLFKVHFVPATETNLDSDLQMKTWTDLGLKRPAYGSEVFFVLDHKLDGSGKEIYLQEPHSTDPANKPGHILMWFYFNPNPQGDGSVAYELDLKRDDGTTADAIYFDPRGFATNEDGTRMGYVAKIIGKVKDSGGTLQVRSQMWFQVTPLGRVSVLEQTGS